jgi:hypothetical protein
VVANQYISQVQDEIQNAIFGNVWNIIAFNSGNQDAEILAKQFKNQVSVNDITSIPRFKAYSKIPRHLFQNPFPKFPQFMNTAKIW